MSKLDAVNAYIKQRVANTQRLIEQCRTEFAFGNADTKNIHLFSECGYPEVITPEMLRTMYKRSAMARAGVDRTLDKCWEKYPEIIEEGNEDEISSPWEKQVNMVMKKAYPFIVEADRRNLVNQYSCLILRINDGKRWDEPVDTTKTKRIKDKAIIGFIPAWQEQCRPSQWNNDENSQDYGQPLLWEYQESKTEELGNDDGKPERVVNIHPDRIISLAEGSFDGSIYSGIPLNEAGFNNLIDLTKIRGSAAESLKKNAARQLHTNYNKDNVSAASLAQQMGVEVSELADMLNSDIEMLNNGIDSALITMGADVNVLSVTPADPNPSWMVAAQEYCASIKKPLSIVVGMMTGRLASDQDRIDHATTAKYRREVWCDHLIKTVVDRLVALNIFDAPPQDGYFIKWQDLLAPSDADKADLLIKLGQANKSFFDAGQNALLSVNEARSLAGMEPIDGYDMPEDMGENDPQEKV